MLGKNIDLSGKVALVTGGSRGLGKDIALAMSENGAKVIICGRKKGNLDQIAEEFRKRGLDLMAQDVNIGKSDQVGTLMQAIDERFGELNILVNNAGMNLWTPSVVEADEGLWDKIVETNLKGTYLVSKYAVPLIKRGGGGKIINISSIAARKVGKGMGIYCVAKAGMEMLTRVLAFELARDNINVNAVAPGVIKTSFSRPLWGDESALNEILKTIPLGRIAETGDVVGAVLFLASGLSNFITGEVITVDGGSMVH